ncbi:alpha/beta hydrolase [Lysobacter soyae]|uniref:Alpha/beta fold hydrolase n=1 Tax=Lysobacter soyae TaxID=2764185 RepID=A0ABX8WSD6_9GAMM|nr:alpha/beta hydrolase [Lysobacter sp. CJ11]QYR53747.1 alpha/beta fold hydrolase [Lysobacter sp. CJ11]
MKRLLPIVCAAFVATTATAQVAPERAKAISTTLLDHLDAGRFEQAEAMFSESMKTAVPLDKMKAAWGSMAGAGTRGDIRLVQKNTSQIALVPMHRGNQDWQATVSIDAQGKVEGLFIQPQQARAPVQAVPANAHFSERELTVGSGADALPATLAMPKGTGPFPGVVLVHGSGPQDRNETVGANRPFLDVARALADQGIAVLRYEKRSKAMPEWYASHPVTIDSETTDDAVMALATLRAQPGIDKKRLFVLGHSQGAMLAPRIGQRDGQVAGLIQWSGPARKLVEVLPEQMRFMGKTGKVPAEKTEENIRLLEAAIKMFRDPGYRGPSLMGQTADYWRSVDTVDPVKDTRASKLPVLLLHGGRDFQVSDTDWQLWQKNLRGDKRIEMKRYPTLNHLGITGTGEPNAAEYSAPGHVDAAMINDIVAWIKRH